MLDRSSIKALLLLALALPIGACGRNLGLDSIAITPSAPQTVATGSTVQYSVTGVFGNASRPSTGSVGSGVTWTSSNTSVATITSAGLATAVGAGTTTITASATGWNGVLTSSAQLTVTGGSGGGGGGGTDNLVSISLTPSAQTVSFPSDTAQFIAIGTTSSGSTINLSSAVSWRSSSASIASIGPSGLATAVGPGTATITALYAPTGGNVVTGTATFTVVSGSSEMYSAVTIIPGSETVSVGQIGRTAQLTALGTLGTSGLQADVTSSSQITWLSSMPTYATVSSTGLVTGLSQGSTTITAELTNPGGGTMVSATATITVISQPEPLASITILPNSITTANLEGTGQFLAYGTFLTAPTLMDITNGFSHPGFPAGCTQDCPTVPVNWISAMPDVFTVNSSGAPGATAGLVTAYGSGNGVIYVTALNPDGTLVYSPSVSFNCPLVQPTYDDSGVVTDPGSCNELTISPPLLVTLTVYNAGLNQTGWLVTAPSATGTPNVIHCGPGSTSGGSVCMATYPVGTTVILTAPAETGVNFGGWSWNCEEQGTISAAGPNSCTVYLGATDPYSGKAVSNVTVGAIFN
jgi:hypothetical protein